MMQDDVCSAVSQTPAASHVLVEPVEHVCSGLLDLGLVCRVDVLPLAVDEAVSLSWEYFHLEVHGALLQVFFQGADLKTTMKVFSGTNMPKLQ